MKYVTTIVEVHSIVVFMHWAEQIFSRTHQK